MSNWSLGLRIAVFGLVSYIKKRNRSWCRSQIKKKKNGILVYLTDGLKIAGFENFAL